MFISATPLEASKGLEPVVAALRAIGEPTRLRVLALLAEGELAVGEIALALGQSQPRVSRHLKLMTEAGVIERAPEGAWVFYRLPMRAGAERKLVESALGGLDKDDLVIARDRERLGSIRADREAAAAAYFEANAADWERVRALHLPDADVDRHILEVAGPGPFDLMVDVGVGVGRMIELFAPRIARAEGFDLSRQMLAIARANLDHAAPGKVSLRIGDAHDPPTAPDIADLVTIHQVLHFLSDPARAVRQAVRALKPGGRLVIIDFAPHELEFLREEHAHRRLGFSDAEIEAWCADAGAPMSGCATLAPERAGDLSVKIWTADKLGASSPESAADQRTIVEDVS